MSDPLSIINNAVSALISLEGELEAHLEGLNPVMHRSQRALVASELSSLREEVRELERRRSRVVAGEATLEPDPEALAQLSRAVDALHGVAGKGAKVESIVGAVGGAVGAAKTVLRAV